MQSYILTCFWLERENIWNTNLDYIKNCEMLSFLVFVVILKTHFLSYNFVIIIINAFLMHQMKLYEHQKPVSSMTIHV